MRKYNKKRRRKRIIYTLQVAWIIVAITTSIMLLIAGNRLLGMDVETGVINDTTVAAQELENGSNIVHTIPDNIDDYNSENHNVLNEEKGKDVINKDNDLENIKSEVEINQENQQEDNRSSSEMSDSDTISKTAQNNNVDSENDNGNMGDKGNTGLENQSNDTKAQKDFNDENAQNEMVDSENIEEANIEEVKDYNGTSELENSQEATDTVEVDDGKNENQIEGNREDSNTEKTSEPNKENVDSNKEIEEQESEDMLTSKNIDVNKPMIALTFDDGPYPAVTNRILDTLSNNNVHATFFVMGNRMEYYGDTVKRAFELGNQIGNHTYSHKDLTKLSIGDLRYEVEYSNELINQYAKEGNCVLRPPYGSRNETVCNNVIVPMIAWSVDTEDWKSRDKDKIITHVLENAKDGDIILMHDLYESTADAVEDLVPELIKRGYQLVTIDDLFAAKGYELEPGKIYHNGRGQ